VIERTSAPLVAFRAWRVTRRGRFNSLVAGEHWPASGIAEAGCLQPAPGMVSHQAPVGGCRCGLYAVDSLATLRRYLRRHLRWRPRLLDDVVIGAVQLWGGRGRPVIVGELRGRPGLQFRAPFGRVLALAEGPRARRAGELLGVPVVAADLLEAVGREYGGVQLRPPAATGRALQARSERSRVAAEGLARLTVIAGRGLRLARRHGWPLLRVLLWGLLRLTWFLAVWTLRIAWAVLRVGLRLYLALLLLALCLVPGGELVAGLFRRTR
jgi:hypothetical protein